MAGLRCSRCGKQMNNTDVAFRAYELRGPSTFPMSHREYEQHFAEAQARCSCGGPLGFEDSWLSEGEYCEKRYTHDDEWDEWADR